MKLLIHSSPISPQCPVHGSSQSSPSVNAVDRLFDVFENGEGRFPVSPRLLFAQCVLASNPKTVVAPEVSKPELQSLSFQSQVAPRKGLENTVLLNGSAGGVSEGREVRRLSWAASGVGPNINLLLEAELLPGLVCLRGFSLGLMAWLRGPQLLPRSQVIASEKY